MPKVSGGVAGTGEWCLLFFGDEPLKYPVEVYARCPKVGPNREVVELHIRAKPGERIDARLMRDFNVESIRRFANFMLDHQLQVGKRRSTDYTALIKRKQFDAAERKIKAKRQADATVKIPPGKDRSMEFYEEIAALYTRLAVVDPRPASAISKANRVPLPTVHGWVKRARDLGLLEPGRRRARP